jgi:L-aspartate oxidase
VFGARAAEAMLGDAHAEPGEETRDDAPHGTGPAASKPVRDALRRQAWQRIGLVRDAAGLREMLGSLAPLRRSLASAAAPDRSAVEDRNLADVAWAMAASALFREESRGSHYRADFEAKDDARFLGHTWLEKGAPRLVDLDLAVPAGARA